MKLFRLLALVASALVVLLLLAVAVAFNSTFQTWAVRRALADRPGWRATIGSVSAGTKRVEIKEARFERDGAVLTLPALAADVPLISAAIGDKVLLSQLVAKGWTLDLSRTQAAAVAPNPAGGVATAGAAVAQALGGVFKQLRLPFDLTVDGVELEGEVILPAGRGRTRLTLRGGGLRAAQEGKFELTADAALADPAVSAVRVRGAGVAAMDTPRTFTRFGAKIEADAHGTQFPNGVTLTAELAAARLAAGEQYSVAVTTKDRQLLALQAEMPPNGQKLDGTWKLDVRDADVAPFALGQPLPVFVATGAGRFDSDATFATVHAAGRLDLTADQLTVLGPHLTEVGAVQLAADFDLTRRGDGLAVQTFTAALAGAQPIARLQALQPFEFNPRTRAIMASDAARDLLAIALEGVPVAWGKSFWPGFVVEGGDLRGELVATPRGGGASLRSKNPVGIAGLTVSQSGRPLVQAVDVALQLSGDYSPQGWQAEAHDFTAKSSGATLFTLEARAGQLAGPEQPLKAAGRLSIDLPSLLQQPALGGAVSVTRGEATIEFAASVAATKEFQAKIALTNLAGDAKAGLEKMPTLTAELRANIAADGQLTLRIPLVLEREDRKSDLLLDGTLKPGRTTRLLDARLTSSQLVIDDAKLLAALVPAEKPKDGPKAAPKAGPPWAGIEGTLNLRLNKVVYAGSFQANDVVGTLRLEGGAIKLETVRAGLGEGGEAKLSGVLIFDASSPQPYALAADLAMTEYNPGPLFRAINPDQPPTVEGRFNVSSKLASRALTLSDLALGAGGNFQLTSRGGVFRGMPINVNSLAENTSRLAGWIASAGTAIGALTGKKEYTDVASKAQAVAEFAKGLNPIPYDQLSVALSRDDALNTTLKDFTLISPEMRLSGSGQARHRPGSTLLDDHLTMDFKLRVRGRQGELLRYLGAIEPQPDDLGYAACTLPLKIGGTIGHPDTAELNQRLAALALEKSGLSEKAAEFLNKLRGGKSADSGAAK